MSLQVRLIFLFSFFYSLTYLLDLLFYCKFRESIACEWAIFRLLLLIVFSVLYGAYRAIYFNPYIRTDYQKWLALTPWNPDKPLPLGPVYLVWRDVVGVGFLTLLCYLNGYFNVFWPAIAFVGAYLFLSSVAILEEQVGVIVVSVFLVPFLIYPHRDPRLTFLVLIIIYSIFYYGLKQQFKNFPWNTDLWKSNLVEKLKTEALNKRLIGWPMNNFMASKMQNCDFSSGLLLSFLLTWWLHVFRWILQDDYSFLLLVLFSIVACFFRTLTYIKDHFSPISLFGRICTLRFIIPGYDKVFIAPVCILFVPVIAILLIPWVNNMLLFESGVFLIFLLAFTLPPSRNKWQLTAPCRMKPPVRMHSNIQPKCTTETRSNFYHEASSGTFSLFKK